MRETASLLAASVDGKEHIFPILRNWQKTLQHKCLICASMESVSQPEMDIGQRLGMTWLNFDLVPIAISSVLSSFIFNLLSLIHSVTSSIQSFKQQARSGKMEGTLDLWRWESSAKKWYERPDWQITVLKGCVYKVNRRGPRTQPSGTPHFRTDGVDSWPNKDRLDMAISTGDKPIKDRARTTNSGM